MIIFTDSQGNIFDVDSTNNPDLIPREVTDGTFDSWSVAKICCYKCEVVDGNVVMLTPRVDSRLIEHIDRLGNEVPKKFAKRAYISDTQAIFPYVEGLITATVVDDLGNSIPCSINLNNLIIVQFEPLDALATVTISIV